MKKPVLMVMAGGTGGHIMPGLAVAHDLESQGWEVLWLGNPERMEGKLVAEHNIELLPMKFSGLRGKGIGTLIKLPFLLVSACLSARKHLLERKPDVVLGMGGYVAFPGGLMARWLKIPLVIHEQNAIAGTANKKLAKFANKVLSGFPQVFPNGQVVGNPVRQSLMSICAPKERYDCSKGPLRILVVGGSLGAQALNTIIPQALALIAQEQRPKVVHQAGAMHIESLQKTYDDLGVKADCVSFIDDMAKAYQNADLVICRAGAMTVAEVAAVGVAALFVPLPHAIDDHQTANAQWLVKQNAAWLQKQSEMSPEGLAQWLSALDRVQCLEKAQQARACAKINATTDIANVCKELIKGK